MLDSLPGSADALAAVLFMTSAMMTLDAYSTFESSPWTAENFGGDRNKRKSAEEYLMHAVGFSMVYAAASAYIARSWWPLLGAAIANAYLVWLYVRAFNRAENSGSTGWSRK